MEPILPFHINRARLGAALAISLAVLSACDAGDYALTAEQKTAAAQAAPLDFDKELAFLMRTCLTALETGAAASPDLSNSGYTKDWAETYVKKGPLVRLGEERDSISLKINSSSVSNVCSINLQGLGENTSERRVLPEEQALIGHATKVLNAAGYRDVSPPTRRARESQKFAKGPIEVSAWARSHYFASTRFFNIKIERLKR